MVRWAVFYVWIAVTLALGIWAFSEFIFGSTSGKRLVLRLLCSLVWPVAMFSESGRNFLLKIEAEET